MPSVPVPNVPPSVFCVRSFGALGDGAHPDTSAIQQAIDATAAAGGGIVRLPPGRYLTGSLRLCSHLVLDILPGATLLGSARLEDYPIVETERTENSEDHLRYLFHGRDLEDVVLRGGGRIDGNGPAFWEPQPHPRCWKRPHPQRVSPMIKIQRSRRLRIENLFIGNSPGWTIHLFCCEQIFIQGLHLENDLYGPNCDGIDLDGCRDVTIANCQITCGDDAICLKTTRHAQSCERIAIANCIFRTNCAAFRIGIETWHDFRQISFTNSIVHQSSRGVAIGMADGAVVEDVVCANLVIETNGGIPMNRGIYIELRESHGWFKGNVDAPVGKIRRILLSQISLITDGRILLAAADGGVLEDVVLRDICVTYPWVEDPVAVKDKSDRYQAANCNPEARVARAVCVVENARRFQLHNLVVTWPEGRTPAGFLPKIERGELLFDPARRPEPWPPFQVFWGRHIDQGLLDLPLAQASQPGLARFHLEDCRLIDRTTTGFHTIS